MKVEKSETEKLEAEKLEAERLERERLVGERLKEERLEAKAIDFQAVSGLDAIVVAIPEKAAHMAHMVVKRVSVPIGFQLK